MDYIGTATATTIWKLLRPIILACNKNFSSLLKIFGVNEVEMSHFWRISGHCQCFLKLISTIRQAHSNIEWMTPQQPTTQHPIIILKIQHLRKLGQPKMLIILRHWRRSLTFEVAIIPMKAWTTGVIIQTVSHLATTLTMILQLEHKVNQMDLVMCSINCSK